MRESSIPEVPEVPDVPEVNVEQLRRISGMAIWLRWQEQGGMGVGASPEGGLGRRYLQHGRSRSRSIGEVIEEDVEGEIESPERCKSAGSAIEAEPARGADRLRVVGDDGVDR